MTIVPGAIVDIGRAILLVHHGMPREALDLALDAHGRAVDVGFEYARSWLAYGVGIAYASLGRVKTARRWFQEASVALAADRNDPRSRPAVAGDLWCAATLGLRDEAAVLRERLDRLVMPTWGWFEGAATRALAWEALLQRDRAAAVAVLRVSANDLREQNSFLLEAEALHDIVRLDAVDDAIVARLTELSGIAEGPLIEARANHATAALKGDATALSELATTYDAMGFGLYAAEAMAQAARLLGRAGASRAAFGSRGPRP